MGWGAVDARASTASGQAWPVGEVVWTCGVRVAAHFPRLLFECSPHRAVSVSREGDEARVKKKNRYGNIPLQIEFLSGAWLWARLWARL